MEYKRQHTTIQPRIIIHGGAGNVTRDMPREKVIAYRNALLRIIQATQSYLDTPSKPPSGGISSAPAYPSALDTATHAVTLLENEALFNSGHGAVFTRDGINELEASVMTSRGHAKRGVGVTGLRRVRNPIRLAAAVLRHGDADLWGKIDRQGWGPSSSSCSGGKRGAVGESGMVGGDDKVVREGGKEEEEEKGKDDDNSSSLDVPSAQGHTLIHGPTAEQLAELYGLELVDPSYFFTQNRWDEHVRALQREREEGRKKGGREGGASWSADEYLPQGTCGAVALDREGVVCVATSTGGITNKLTGRIGDTPTVGAGFWAEEWEEEEEGKSSLLSLPAVDPWQRMVRVMSAMPGPAVHVSSTLRSFLADCMPSPFLYAPVTSSSVQTPYHPTSSPQKLYTTRSVAFSGTGNGDSFLRVAAVRTVAGIARWAGVSARQALRQVAGPGGELERSAGARWGRTGEGEGGMIGIEVVVSRDGAGNMVETRAEVLDDRNCAGMFRAYVDDDGKTVVKLWDADETLS